MKVPLRWFFLPLLLLPLILILYLSVVSAWVFPSLWEEGISMDRWKGLFDEGNHLRKSFGLSLFLSTGISLTSTIVGFCFSAFLSLSQRWAGWYRIAFFPYLIAPVSFAALLQYYFVRFDLNGSLTGVWLAQLLFILPFSVIIFSSFWSRNTIDLYRQGMILGADPWVSFMRIVWPLAKPWFVFSLILCFLASWFEYGITGLIGVGKVRTLTIDAMLFVNEANMFQAALASCLLVLPVLLILLTGFFASRKIYLRQ